MQEQKEQQGQEQVVMVMAKQGLGQVRVVAGLLVAMLARSCKENADLLTYTRHIGRNRNCPARPPPPVCIEQSITLRPRDPLRPFIVILIFFCIVGKYTFGWYAAR